MRRTNLLLLLYGVPTVVLIAILFRTWGVQVPWYVLVFVIPFALTVVVAVAGLIATSGEEDEGAGQEELDVLIAALGPTSSGTAAATALARIAPALSVEALGHLLLGLDAEGAQAVKEALARLGNEEEERRLRDSLEHASSANVRGLMAEGLARIGTTRSVEALCRALRDPAAMVRKRAALALGEIKDQRASASLTVVVNEDKVAEPRSLAADALAKVAKGMAI